MVARDFENATPPTAFNRSQPKFMGLLATMVEYGLLITFLGNWPRFEHFVALSNFNIAVNGKILKCAIS